MSRRNISNSLYQESNNNLRKRIVENTLIQYQPSPEKERYFRQPNIDQKSSDKPEERRQFTDRNMKFKLEQLAEKLQQFLNELRGVRQENRQLIEFTSLLKQNLIYEDLYSIKSDFDQKINGFANHIRSVKNTNEARYNQIYGECSQLWKKTQEAREHVFNIGLRVEKLEEKMGFREMYREWSV